MSTSIHTHPQTCRQTSVAQVWCVIPGSGWGGLHVAEAGDWNIFLQGVFCRVLLAKFPVTVWMICGTVVVVVGIWLLGEVLCFIEVE